MRGWNLTALADRWAELMLWAIAIGCLGLLASCAGIAAALWR